MKTNLSTEDFFILLNEVKKELDTNGWTSYDFVVYENYRWINIATPEKSKKMEAVFKRYSFFELIQMKIISQTLQTVFTGEIARLMALMNGYLPRVRELSRVEKTDESKLDFSSNGNINGVSQIARLFLEQNPSYIRRAIGTAVELDGMTSDLRSLSEQERVRMLQIAAMSEMDRKSFDDNTALKSIMLAPDQETGVERYEFVRNHLHLLRKVAGYRRNSCELASFLFAIPSLVATAVAEADRQQEVELIPTWMDWFHRAVAFNTQLRTLSSRADNVCRRFTLGYPDYNELLTVLKEIDTTVSYGVESFLISFSYGLKEFAEFLKPEEMERFLDASGILRIFVRQTKIQSRHHVPVDKDMSD